MALKEKILEKAQKLVQKGYIDKAIAEYKSALDLDPKDVSIRLRLGDLYVKLGRKGEAVAEYTEAAKINSQKGFYLKAIAVYKQVLKLDESILDIHSRLADLYVKQRLVADAVSEYSYIVNAFERLGRKNEATELLKKMVGIDPENIGTRLKLAERYQKSGFDKDAIEEYSRVCDKLVAEGKLDRAEKVCLGLYQSYPEEKSVLERLAKAYKLRGDDAQFLRFSRILREICREKGDLEGAGAACRAILDVNPGDAESLDFMRQFKPAAAATAGPETTPADTTAEPATAPKAVAVKGKAPAEPARPEAGEAPVAEPPHVEEETAARGASEAREARAEGAPEEIIVSLEGFEEAQEGPSAEEAGGAEAGASEVERDVEKTDASRPAKAPSGAPVPAPEPEIAEDGEPLVEIDIPGLAGAAEEPLRIAFQRREAEAEALKAIEDAALKRDETPVMHEIEGPAQAEGVAPSEAAETPASVEPQETAGTHEFVFTEEAVIESERTAVEKEAEGLPIETSEAAFKAEEEQPPVEPAPVFEEVAPVVEEATRAEAFEVTAPSEEKVSGEEIISDRAFEEVYPSSEAPATIDATTTETKGGATEGPSEAPEVEVKLTGAVTEAEEKTRPEGVEVELIEAHEEARDATEDELSQAITELMERIEPEEHLLDSYKGGIKEELGGTKEAETKEEGKKEEYVDLTAELGMEETLKDMAGPISPGESREAFDEFKNGIGKQLSREDSETHYNLGIAYMEMELYNEASKEFKIALKDPRLEFDCYTRLGICAIHGEDPEEAIMFYLKALKIPGKSQEERKGLMYELALAYESSGNIEEAAHLFRSICEIDPGYREVAAKVRELEMLEMPRIPINDGLIEVELL